MSKLSFEPVGKNFTNPITLKDNTTSFRVGVTWTNGAFRILDPDYPTNSMLVVSNNSGTNFIFSATNQASGHTIGIPTQPYERVYADRVYVRTNGTPPAGSISYGFLWNSNRALYWVTESKTNLLNNGF